MAPSHRADGVTRDRDEPIEGADGQGERGSATTHHPPPTTLPRRLGDQVLSPRCHNSTATATPLPPHHHSIHHHPLRPTQILLMGNGSVGKSSIIQRLVDDGFNRQYLQTVGCDFFERRVTLKGDNTVMMQVVKILARETTAVPLPPRRATTIDVGPITATLDPKPHHVAGLGHRGPVDRVKDVHDVGWGWSWHSCWPPLPPTIATNRGRHHHDRRR